MSGMTIIFYPKPQCSQTEQLYADVILESGDILTFEGKGFWGKGPVKTALRTLGDKANSGKATVCVEFAPKIEK